jgi:ferritin-like metal-binding protein YciE
MNQLQEIFFEELEDIYSAESQLIKALPKMAKAAQEQELKDALTDHLGQTENHVERLKQVFQLFNKTPKAKKCKGMEGLIDEGKEIISENEDTPGLDAALICAAQKVEHYEMASYGSLRAWAQAFGNEQAARLLQETLNEEEMADEKLNQIAQRSNRTAVEAMA